MKSASIVIAMLVGCLLSTDALPSEPPTSYIQASQSLQELQVVNEFCDGISNEVWLAYRALASGKEPHQLNLDALKPLEPYYGTIDESSRDQIREHFTDVAQTAYATFGDGFLDQEELVKEATKIGCLQGAYEASSDSALSVETLRP